MHVDNSRHLAAAPQRRHDELNERCRVALRRLDRDGAAITFVAVAAAAHVSKAFLYKTRALRDEIDRLRCNQPASVARIPAAQRRSDVSRDAVVARLTDDNRRMRAGNRELRTVNEALLGQLREDRPR